MKLTSLFIFVIVALSLLFSSTDAAPGKIPVKAIKQAGKVIGKGLRAINIAGTTHDVVSFFRPKKKKH
ncbi:hypothetical protein O3G_MSEX006794 [Manduca sexta]|uniref:Moricin n=2 Tax=Manduca sexta TaxID=7130 RepID=MOR_MANSE|nr:RecName: Full=Moricin; Flags: Precursor [Manduca sexta]AAO74637.1 antimicrobial peptide moricin [Manduca sexta]KAG6450800.1 hypothetical protein O3G_MSEX006794 [Manduca sexta]KAG6450801.1 hypothetical protein O3G_MSEX006794 [Manduca sexta]